MQDDEYIQQVRETMATHGWALQGVFPDTENDSPGFTYTVGFCAALNHPELIVFGLPFNVVGAILNEIGQGLRDGAPPLRAGDGVRISQGEFVWRVLRVERPERFLTVAALVQGGPVEALQLVWPDAQNRPPWIEGSTITPAVQPLLGPIPRGEQ